jgi:beta-glucanase (GH16 family)
MLKNKYFRNRIVKAFGIVLFLLAISPAGFSQECNHLVFSDEFNYEGAPDQDHWNYETGAGGWGNNELQNYTDSRDNSYVSEGTLKIHAKKSLGGSWTSARMVTAGKASWLYGRFDIRAKLPEGVGTWPAIWMMPETSTYGGWPSSGEIDIMEHVGYDLGNVHGSVHTEAYNHKIGTQKSGSISVPDAHTNFHVYSVEWTPDDITWYVDGVKYYTFNNENKTYKEWPFDHAFFLILNIAIGGDWGGVEGVDPNMTEAIMEVDYVRVYKNALPFFDVRGSDTAENGQEVTFSVPGIDGITYQWSIPEDAEIIAGHGSSEILVRWGNSSGEVSCTMISQCEEKTGNPIDVQLVKRPDSAPYVVSSLDFSGNTLWMVPEQAAGNSFSVEAQDKDTKVSFSVENPSSKPGISMYLPFLLDMSEYRSVQIPVKVLDGDTPDVLRFDFIDQNGNVTTADLFSVDDVVGNHHFHLYTYTFGTNSTIWNISEIKEIRTYVNYGFSAQSGSGTFVLGDISLAPAGFFETPVIPEGDRFNIDLSVESDGWHSPNSGETAINLSGNNQLDISYNSVEASDNNYIDYNFASPVDLHQFGQIHLKFPEEGTFPAQMKVCLMDENGILNLDDAFTISDFSVISSENLTLSYNFGKVEDGGDFLPCRVKGIRIWLDSDQGNESGVNFSISDIWFSEFDYGSGIFGGRLKLSELRIWPNPSSQFINWDLKDNVPCSWKLFSSEGKMVKNGINSGWDNQIDVSDLPSGIYLLFVEDDHQNLFKSKVVVQ